MTDESTEPHYKPSEDVSPQHDTIPQDDGESPPEDQPAPFKARFGSFV